MDNKIKGTQTEKNLAEALINESLARNKYTFYASIAKKEGYEQIADILLKIADNEKEHAKIWFKYLNLLSDTIDNLEDACKNEAEEWMDTYQRFATIALQEGFPEISEKFRLIAKIEKNHEKTFKKLLLNLNTNEVFKKEDIKIWECRNCGNIIVGTESPNSCPVCDHPQSYYEIKNTNY